MLTFRQAAWISLSLHIAVGSVLFVVSKGWVRSQPSVRKQTETRPVMVDFVRLGARSAAPVLGTPSAGKGSGTRTQQPQSKVQQPQSNKPQLKVQPKPVVPYQEKPKSKSNPPKPIPQPARKSSQKPAQKPKNPVVPKKALPSSPPGSYSKKSSLENRAKVDLTKRSAANSMDELMNNVQVPKGTKGGHDANAAFAETYGEELTGTDLDLLNRHMKQFWNMPSGHEKAYDIVVEVELFIRRDGTIEKATLVDLARYRKDPEYRIAAESALRAVLDPDCSPLPLNPAKYDQWKHMIFVFDPREMCR